MRHNHYINENGNKCYLTKNAHFTVLKTKSKKPVILETILGCGHITRIHAAYLLRESRR